MRETIVSMRRDPRDGKKRHRTKPLVQPRGRVGRKGNLMPRGKAMRGVQQLLEEEEEEKCRTSSWQPQHWA